MKNLLLASVALFFVGSSVSFAAMPALDLDPAFSTVVPHDFLQLAKDGGDDSGGNSGSGNSGSGNSGSGHSGGDDGDDDSDDDDSADDDSNDDSPQSNSNRRKPRIPGGSGCDDPGDVEEHAECRAE